MRVITVLFSKARIGLLIAAALLVGAALIYRAAATDVSKLISQARQDEQAVWRLKVEEIKSIAARAEADQARRAAEIEADATARIAAAERNLIELEKDNAALPSGSSCGLGVDRVRLLKR